MLIEEALLSLEGKFTSGNSIEVERATILREEWLAILEYRRATKELERFILQYKTLPH